MLRCGICSSITWMGTRIRASGTINLGIQGLIALCLFVRLRTVSVYRRSQGDPIDVVLQPIWFEFNLVGGRICSIIRRRFRSMYERNVRAFGRDLYFWNRNVCAYVRERFISRKARGFYDDPSEIFNASIDFFFIWLFPNVVPSTKFKF